MTGNDRNTPARVRGDDAPSGASFAPRPFHPAWWLPGAHAQTVCGKFLRPDPGLVIRRERVETPDGDFLDLDFAGEAPGLTPADAPAVLVLHGLEGSALRHYMLVAYRELLRCGLRPIGLNFRSCGGEPNRLARFYHSGDTDDLRFALELLAGRPGGVSGAIGFSLGGNVLLKFLGEEGAAGRAPIQAAVAISVPFDLAEGARTLEHGLMARVYTEYFLRSLREKVRRKEALLRAHVDVEAGLAARTLWAFDDIITAPLHGFESAEHYYHCSSSTHYLERIQTPTLLLQAEDDPFLPPRVLPREAVARNPQLTAAFTKRGGHVGFIAGTPWAPRFWAEEEAARFLAGRLRATR
jgi:predicted alpha/beta-fold hydrolase